MKTAKIVCVMAMLLSVQYVYADTVNNNLGCNRYSDPARNGVVTAVALGDGFGEKESVVAFTLNSNGNQWLATSKNIQGSNATLAASMLEMLKYAMLTGDMVQIDCSPDGKWAQTIVIFNPDNPNQSGHAIKKHATNASPKDASSTSSR